MMAIQLESGALDTEEKLTAYMRAVLERNRGQVYGSCVAFTPFGFQYGRTSMVTGRITIWTKDSLQFEQLAKPDYNYFNGSGIAARADAGATSVIWSAPYFDDGGGQTLMITYSVPVRRDDLFWAIITVDIELAEMLNDVSAMSGDEQETVGRSAYAFIIDKDGNYLAFPGQNPEHVQEHRTAGEESPAGQCHAQLGKEGVMRTVDPRDGKQAWVAYAPHPRRSDVRRHRERAQCRDVAGHRFRGIARTRCSAGAGVARHANLHRPRRAGAALCGDHRGGTLDQPAASVNCPMPHGRSPTAQSRPEHRHGQPDRRSAASREWVQQDDQGSADADAGAALHDDAARAHGGRVDRRTQYPDEPAAEDLPGLPRPARDRHPRDGPPGPRSRRRLLRFLPARR